jgi:hypothetical protein
MAAVFRKGANPHRSLERENLFTEPHLTFSKMKMAGNPRIDFDQETLIWPVSRFT